MKANGSSYIASRPNSGPRQSASPTHGCSASTPKRPRQTCAEPCPAFEEVAGFGTRLRNSRLQRDPYQSGLRSIRSVFFEQLNERGNDFGFAVECLHYFCGIALREPEDSLLGKHRARSIQTCTQQE